MLVKVATGVSKLRYARGCEVDGGGMVVMQQYATQTGIKLIPLSTPFEQHVINSRGSGNRWSPEPVLT